MHVHQKKTYWCAFLLFFVRLKKKRAQDNFVCQNTTKKKMSYRRGVLLLLGFALVAAQKQHVDVPVALIVYDSSLTTMVTALGADFTYHPPMAYDRSHFLAAMLVANQIDRLGGAEIGSMQLSHIRPVMYNFNAYNNNNTNSTFAQFAAEVASGALNPNNVNGARLPPSMVIMPMATLAQSDDRSMIFAQLCDATRTCVVTPSSATKRLFVCGAGEVAPNHALANARTPADVKAALAATAANIDPLCLGKVGFRRYASMLSILADPDYTAQSFLGHMVYSGQTSMSIIGFADNFIPSAFARTVSELAPRAGVEVKYARLLASAPCGAPLNNGTEMARELVDALRSADSDFVVLLGVTGNSCYCIEQMLRYASDPAIDYFPAALAIMGGDLANVRVLLSSGVMAAPGLLEYVYGVTPFDPNTSGPEWEQVSTQGVHTDPFAATTNMSSTAVFYAAYRDAYGDAEVANPYMVYANFGGGSVVLALLLNEAAGGRTDGGVWQDLASRVNAPASFLGPISIDSTGQNLGLRQQIITQLLDSNSNSNAVGTDLVSHIISLVLGWIYSGLATLVLLLPATWSGHYRLKAVMRQYYNVSTRGAVKMAGLVGQLLAIAFSFGVASTCAFFLITLQGVTFRATSPTVFASLPAEVPLIMAFCIMPLLAWILVPAAGFYIHLYRAAKDLSNSLRGNRAVGEDTLVDFHRPTTIKSASLPLDKNNNNNNNNKIITKIAPNILPSNKLELLPGQTNDISSSSSSSSSNILINDESNAPHPPSPLPPPSPLLSIPIRHLPNRVSRSNSYAVTAEEEKEVKKPDETAPAPAPAPSCMRRAWRAFCAIRAIRRARSLRWWVIVSLALVSMLWSVCAVLQQYVMLASLAWTHADPQLVPAHWVGYYSMHAATTFVALTFSGYIYDNEALMVGLHMLATLMMAFIPITHTSFVVRAVASAPSDNLAYIVNPTLLLVVLGTVCISMVALLGTIMLRRAGLDLSEHVRAVASLQHENTRTLTALVKSVGQTSEAHYKARVHELQEHFLDSQQIYFDHKMLLDRLDAERVKRDLAVLTVEERALYSKIITERYTIGFSQYKHSVASIAKENGGGGAINDSTVGAYIQTAATIAPPPVCAPLPPPSRDRRKTPLRGAWTTMAPLPSSGNNNNNNSSVAWDLVASFDPDFLVHHRLHRHFLKEALDNHYTPDYWYFLQCMRNFNSLRDDVERRTDAIALYILFIAPDSPFCINLKSEDVQQIARAIGVDKIAALLAPLHRGSDAVVPLSPPTPTLASTPIPSLQGLFSKVDAEAKRLVRNRDNLDFFRKHKFFRLHAEQVFELEHGDASLEIV